MSLHDAAPALTLLYLYPLRMNIYGDRGNVQTLERRASWRGWRLDVVRAEIGDDLDGVDADLILIGGAEDHAQRAVIDDLHGVKAQGLRTAVDSGAVVLAICGGYQLLGSSYRPARGEALKGLGLLPVHTVHPGVDARRCIGNIVVERGDERIVGFENHGGRTYRDGGDALGRVVAGFGNNGDDGEEGCVDGHVFGTYLHGPLLPKNPGFADRLLGLAALRHGLPALEPLNDALEHRAHAAALSQIPRR